MQTDQLHAGDHARRRAQRSPELTQRRQSAADSMRPAIASRAQAIGFVDNRPSSIAQRQIQSAIDTAAQVQQFKAMAQSANDAPVVQRIAQRQEVLQGNWKHWALGGVLGGMGALAMGASLPIIAGVAGVAGIAGGVAGHFMGGKKKPPYKFGDNVREHYQGWEESSGQNAEYAGRDGITVKARHNRGAPYLTKSGVGDRYKDFLGGTRGDEADGDVANDLLNNTGHAIRTPDQKNNAAMMEAVVGLAEEWRKHGAAWVYRAILRGVSAGQWTLAQVPQLFAFVKSANSGRRQVARLQDVKAGRLPATALVGEEGAISGYGSDIDDDGFESDEEVRGRHGMKGKRLYSTKYDSDEG